MLAAHDAHATFFVIGSWVERLPEIVRDMAARGHELGNHTWTHVDGDRTRELATLRHEVARTSDVLEQFTGSRPTLMRPPYGSDPGRFARVSAEVAGLEATVLWSVQSFDWQDPDDHELIVEQVLSEVEPGAIVLFHDGQRETNDASPRMSTLAALPAILERLRADAYELLTVSELLVA